MSHRALSDTLVEYDAEFMRLEKVANAKLDVDTLVADQNYIVRLKTPELSESRIVGHLHRQPSGTFEYAVLNAFARLEGRSRCALQARTLADALDEVKHLLRTPSAAHQALRDDTMSQLVVDHLITLNRLACQSDCLPAYAEALAAAWGGLMAEDVKDDMIVTHMEQFALTALGYAKRIAKGQVETAARNLVMSAVVDAAITAFSKQSEGDDTNKEQSPPVH